MKRTVRVGYPDSHLLLILSSILRQTIPSISLQQSKQTPQMQPKFLHKNHFCIRLIDIVTHLVHSFPTIAEHITIHISSNVSHMSRHIICLSNDPTYSQHDQHEHYHKSVTSNYSSHNQFVTAQVVCLDICSA